MLTFVIYALVLVIVAVFILLCLKSAEFDQAIKNTTNEHKEMLIAKKRAFLAECGVDENVMVPDLQDAAILAGVTLLCAYVGWAFFSILFLAGFISVMNGVTNQLFAIMTIQELETQLGAQAQPV